MGERVIYSFPVKKLEEKSWEQGARHGESVRMADRERGAKSGLLASEKLKS
jgi:hypothetical protein